MTEEKMNTLRQADTNLRDALRMDEAERPQMPANLNERLMQRMAVSEKPVKRRIVWPWIAAACVAGVMMVWLTPPKDEASPLTPLPEARGTQKTKEVLKPHVEKVDEPEIAKVEETQIAVPTTKAVKKARKTEKPLLAQETKVEEPAEKPAIDEATNDLAVAENAKPQEKMVTLTERDIPITRPENYKYTPEELALMKKQANEAYLRWAQLELEIAKHQLEQTAQK